MILTIQNFNPSVNIISIKNECKEMSFAYQTNGWLIIRLLTFTRTVHFFVAIEWANDFDLLWFYTYMIFINRPNFWTVGIV